MLIMHMALLWALVCVHVVGGAFLFNCLFRRESPWLGFIVPALALVMITNFVEHGVGFFSFQWALPVTFLGCLWMIVRPGNNWRRLWLPTTVFLAAFTFTLAIHGLKPNIEAVRDGRLDTHLIADYSTGLTLPPMSTWEPPFKQLHYYSFEHYAASVMDRLLGLDVGTGFNLAGALTTAFIFFLVGAIAWRLGGHRVWIVLTSVVLSISAMSGAVPYLWLLAPGTNEPNDAANLLNRADPNHWQFAFSWLIGRVDGSYDQRELLVPGYWGWIGSFHSVVAGQFLTLLSVYCLVEMVRRRQTCAPWICGLGACLLMLVCSTWGLPFMGLLFLSGVMYCLWKGIYPRNFRVVLIGWGAMAVCMAPMLMYYLQEEAPGVGGVGPHMPAQLAEYVIQWWPVYLPAAILLFFWRKLNPAVLIVMALVPVGLWTVDHYNVTDHLDMTGKIWGYLFGAASAVVIPSVARLRAYWVRGVFGLILAAGGLSMCFWADFTHRTIQNDDRWHIEGLGDLRDDPVKARILHDTGVLEQQVIVPGICEWNSGESVDISTFTGNYAYVADDFDLDCHFNDTFCSEGKRRADAINAIYAGKSRDALTYLRDHGIAALVIWPDDNISNEVLAKLKNELGPGYWYQECRNDDAGPNDPNGGVFLVRRHSETSLPLATY
jgi:hypothetical protein